MKHGQSDEQKIERVRMMASGDMSAKWDLSPNDVAALKHLLAEYDRMRSTEARK